MLSITRLVIVDGAESPVADPARGTHRFEGSPVFSAKGPVFPTGVGHFEHPLKTKYPLPTALRQEERTAESAAEKDAPFPERPLFDSL